MKNLLKNIVFSAVIFVIFFMGLELFQRVRYYFISGEKFYLTYGFNRASAVKSIDTYEGIPFVNHGGKYYSCTPGTYRRHYRGNSFNVNINSLGLRGREIRIDKQKDVFRIVIMGGSSVQGLESPDGDTISSRLEELFNSGERAFLKNINKKKAQVINAGMCAHDSGSMLNMLQAEILRLKPDLILIYEAFNDHRHSGFFGGKVFEDNFYVKLLSIKILSYLNSHSLIFSSMHEKFTLFAKNKVSFEMAREISGRHEDNLIKMIKVCNDNSIEPVLIKQPLYIKGSPTFQDRNRMDDIEKKIRGCNAISFDDAYYWIQSKFFDIMDKVSAQYNISIIDPTREMCKDPAYFNDIVHLTEKGNGRLAEIICNGYMAIKSR